MAYVLGKSEDRLPAGRRSIPTAPWTVVGERSGANAGLSGPKQTSHTITQRSMSGNHSIEGIN